LWLRYSGRDAVPTLARRAVIATTLNVGANLLIANRVRELSRRGVDLEQWHHMIRLGDVSKQT
jgi:hypothetical protein